MVGLILPTMPQDTTPGWAAHYGSTAAELARGSAAEPADPIRELSDLCRRAEELGASALWACDHLFWNGPVLECITALTVAATATSQAMLGSCVIQLPLRQAAAVAKQTASLQQLSRGRFVLGVGVGSHIGEYRQSGIDYHTRGRQLDGGIAEVRRSWRIGEGRGSDGGKG
ncbi:MAG: LLM class flavin-dependent oxidoreductase, partial [Acidimicrobiales bacterium]